MDKNEITSLNFSDLDVEELEHRLELAVANAEPLGVWCDCNDLCPCKGGYSCNHEGDPCGCYGFKPCTAKCPTFKIEP